MVDGAIRVDFSESPEILSEIGKPMLLEILRRQGAMIDDLNNWQPSIKGNTFYLRGKLSDGGSRRIMSVLDEEVGNYLFLTRDAKLPFEEAHKTRMDVSSTIAHRWNQIIDKYDDRGDTVAPVLEIYQRLRGVFVQEESKHHLHRQRPIVLALMSLILLSSLSSAIWVFVKRSSTVVQASQPPFLWLICCGIAVMGSSLFTMGVDDGMASQAVCSVACMATPWLACLGFR